MSFGWLGTFRVGQWRVFRDFNLEERSGVSYRVKAIEAELSRIGEVTAYYEQTKNPETGEVTVSEKRVGMRITSGTSLEKLMQAYVANGGNPLDISMFLKPDKTFLIASGSGELKQVPLYPYDGVISPKSVEYSTDGEYQGGFLPLKKYAPAKSGGRISEGTVNSEVAEVVAESRKWISQEIKEKRNDIEARIIKLCDLREQLENERDILLVRTLGGTVQEIVEPEEEMFDPRYRLSEMLDQIDGFLFDPVDQEGKRDPAKVRKDLGMLDLKTLFPDDEDGEDAWTAL
jgi:hypothetical protein